MLSRVACRIYWLARYIERVENTARLVNTYHFLLMDMPRGTKLGWDVLPDIVSGYDLYDENYTRHDERNTVKFMLADSYHPGSLMNSIKMARENARTSREELPGDAWEVINELYLYVRDHVDEALARRGRFVFLTEIIARCQQITGLLAGTMTHDNAYDFIRLGRNLERADMTTRVIDIGAMSLLDEDRSEVQDYHIWTSMLHALGSYQMYRKDVHLGVSCVDVLNYLLNNSRFPRSVEHCIDQVEECITALPMHKKTLMTIRKIYKLLDRVKPMKMTAEKLHEEIDLLQLRISTVDELIGETWFV